jgi:hypothetical protein
MSLYTRSYENPYSETLQIGAVVELRDMLDKLTFDHSMQQIANIIARAAISSALHLTIILS